MSELRDLYQDILLDHNRRPRNRGPLPEPTHQAGGHNPLCGDHVRVMIRVEEDRVIEAKFEGEGCAISVASASMMTEAMKGKSVQEAERLFDAFRRAMTDEGATMDDIAEEHEELRALEGVRDYPVRIKCATLAWHAFHAALRGEATATTE